MPAAGAAVGEARGRAVEVDADGVGDADQPSQGVAKLVLQLCGVTTAERLGHLTDLLHPPAEGAVDPAGTVALAEGGLDASLELGQ